MEKKIGNPIGERGADHYGVRGKKKNITPFEHLHSGIGSDEKQSWDNESEQSQPVK